MTEVSVESLAFDKVSKAPVVLLKDKSSDRVLPIWIGPAEASAIAMHMGGIPFDRPLTHDLLVSVLGCLGGTLQRVLITRVEDSTYYAQLIIDRDGEVISVDARPSDSIAVALRTEAGIFCDDQLLETAAKSGSEGDADEGEAGGGDPAGAGERDAAEDDAMSGEALEQYLRGMRPEDLGRFEG